MKQKRSAEHTGNDMPNPIQIQKFLKGIDYPVAKEELISQATDNGADDAVLQALNELDDTEYDSPTAVSHQLTKGRNK